MERIMIGQSNLQSQIKQIIENDKFPRFSIFVGPKGSGKRTFVRNVILKSMMPSLYEEVGIKVEDIRNLITDAYKIHSTTTYFIPNADNMSEGAKNALLKVTEEPPNKAYFIMTLADENNTLETIRSRAMIFHMDRYMPDEIEQYAIEYSKGSFNGSLDIIRDICETPGDVNNLGDNPLKFYNYAELVVNNIAEVSVANVFKIPSKVALKDGAEGYDLKLFWKAFMKICMRIGRVNGIPITSKYLQKLRIKGINKQMLLDNWILEIRESWM